MIRLTRLIHRQHRHLDSLPLFQTCIHRRQQSKTSSKMSLPSVAGTDALADSDPEQVRLMAERVIRVDSSDNVTGHMSKKDSHLQSNDLPLHRAFSVFLFDSQGRMLLQQRAPTKITFPSFWTNTVCSHPLYTPKELGKLDNNNSVQGAKHAALRKLTHELGVQPGHITLDDLHYMTRILYRAPCDDGIWGEHELDYVFFAQKDVPLQPEPNEVCNVKYVAIDDLKDMFTEADQTQGISLKLTPWFRHIVQSFAWDWWKLLLDKGLPALQQVQDTDNIRIMR